MDADTVDQNYAQLQQQANQTGQLIQTLAAKLQTVAASGDANAREWQLDLKEIALGIQQEQGQVTLLLQSIHSLVDNHVQATEAAPPQQYQQPPQQYQQAPQQYQQPPQQYQQAPQQYQQAPMGMGGGMMGGMGGGGTLQRFLHGGFGQAMATGAAFGIGSDIINKII
jgi:hypothetical protein